jgi:hypothetical protein
VSVARVALLCPDLLFGSRVEGALRAAGHEVTASGPDVFVVDLTEDGNADRLPADGIPAIGFYPHVDVETRKRALAAGYDAVVPRSKMARETVAVVEGVLGR